jgi:hypothetical protein
MFLILSSGFHYAWFLYPGKLNDDVDLLYLLWSLILQGHSERMQNCTDLFRRSELHFWSLNRWQNFTDAWTFWQYVYYWGLLVLRFQTATRITFGKTWSSPKIRWEKPKWCCCHLPLLCEVHAYSHLVPKQSFHHNLVF